MVFELLSKAKINAVLPKPLLVKVRPRFFVLLTRKWLDRKTLEERERKVLRIRLQSGPIGLGDCNGQGGVIFLLDKIKRRSGQCLAVGNTANDKLKIGTTCSSLGRRSR